jgi:hypothetical protein
MYSTIVCPFLRLSFDFVMFIPPDRAAMPRRQSWIFRRVQFERTRRLSAKGIEQKAADCNERQKHDHYDGILNHRLARLAFLCPFPHSTTILTKTTNVRKRKLFSSGDAA